MRRPAERLPQRRLVYQLRYAIDEGKMIEAANLADAHPRGMRSAHVIRNVGARRLGVLARARARRHVDAMPARSASFDG